MSFLSVLSSLCSVAQSPARPVSMYAYEWQEPAAVFVQNPHGGVDPRHPGSFAWNMARPGVTDILADIVSCF